MSSPFNDALFEYVLQDINTCTEKWVNKYDPTGKNNYRNEYTPCCTTEEKTILMNAIQIVMDGSNPYVVSGVPMPTYKQKCVYFAVLSYYYSFKVFEFYVGPEYRYDCLKRIISKWPRHSIDYVNYIINSLTHADEPWAKTVRRMFMGMGPEETFVSGGRKYRNKSRKHRRNKHHSRKSTRSRGKK